MMLRVDRTARKPNRMSEATLKPLSEKSSSDAVDAVAELLDVPVKLR